MARKRSLRSTSFSSHCLPKDGDDSEEAKRTKTVQTEELPEFDNDIKSVADLKEDFKAIVGIHIRGSPEFSVCGNRLYPDLPYIPLVHVPDFGVIPTPMTKLIFDALQSWHHSESGEGKKDGLIDLNQNSLTISNDKIEFLNSYFDEDFQKVVIGDIASSLEVLPTVKFDIKLQGLDIWGSKSKPCLSNHVIPEDVFGVVIVFLPSHYKNSKDDTIEVRYRNEVNVCEYKYDDPDTHVGNVFFGCAYIAFYAGCQVDMGEITDGYLSYLVYFLSQSDYKHSAPVPYIECERWENEIKLCKSLQEYIFSLDVPFLCLALNDSYIGERSCSWLQYSCYTGSCSPTKDFNFTDNEDWLREHDKKVLSLLKGILTRDRKEHGCNRYYLYLAVAKMTIHERTVPDEDCSCSESEFDDDGICQYCGADYEEESRSLVFEQLIPLNDQSFKVDRQKLEIHCQQPANQLINFDITDFDENFWDVKRTENDEKNCYTNRVHRKLSFMILRADCAAEVLFKANSQEGLRHLKQLVLDNDLVAARKGIEIVFPLTQDTNLVFSDWKRLLLQKDYRKRLLDIIMICGTLKDKPRTIKALSSLEGLGLNREEDAIIVGNAIAQLAMCGNLVGAFTKFINVTCRRYYIHCVQSCCLVPFINPAEITTILLRTLIRELEGGRLKAGIKLNHLKEVTKFMIVAKTITVDNFSPLLNHLQDFHGIVQLAGIALIHEETFPVYKAILGRAKELISGVCDDLNEKVQGKYDSVVKLIVFLQDEERLVDCHDFLDALLSSISRVYVIFKLWATYVNAGKAAEPVLEKMGKRTSELMRAG